jgi:ABC-type transporter Mla MlaB component
MLRITVQHDRQGIRLILEGRLHGPTLDEVERCWTSRDVARKDAAMVVDLRGVTYVSADGKALLARMPVAAPGFSRQAA